uniref:Uncharacterized protein n=1 Tax=Ascaris lumbricoides TaxID=6252 RepID=A0A0M3HMT6_ASCLU
MQYPVMEHHASDVNNTNELGFLCSINGSCSGLRRCLKKGSSERASIVIVLSCNFLRIMTGCIRRHGQTNAVRGSGESNRSFDIVASNSAISGLAENVAFMFATSIRRHTSNKTE